MEEKAKQGRFLKRVGWLVAGFSGLLAFHFFSNVVVLSLFPSMGHFTQWPGDPIQPTSGFLILVFSYLNLIQLIVGTLLGACFLVGLFFLMKKKWSFRAIQLALWVLIVLVSLIIVLNISFLSANWYEFGLYPGTQKISAIMVSVIVLLGLGMKGVFLYILFRLRKPEIALSY